jgi:hypothetical protein
MMYLLLDILVLRVMILYHIMIPLSPLFINCHAILDFCRHGMHNISYDTFIVTSRICMLHILIKGNSYEARMGSTVLKLGGKASESPYTKKIGLLHLPNNSLGW